MLKAYIEQFVGVPYDFPSYHKAIREPYDYYQVTSHIYLEIFGIWAVLTDG